MDTTPMLDRLLAEHRQIEAQADLLSAMLDQPVPDLERLKDARWAFAKTTMQHLAYEDRHLYLPLENHASAEVAAVARRFKQDLRLSQAAFEAHTARWTAAATIADWPGYRLSVRSQLQGLRDRIRAEEAELFPLAEQLPAGVPAASNHNWARAAWNVRETLER